MNDAATLHRLVAEANEPSPFNTKSEGFVAQEFDVDLLLSGRTLPTWDVAGGFPSETEPGVHLVPVGCYGLLAKVDSEDYPLVMGYRWHGPRYAQARYRVHGRDFRIQMHRLILLLGEGDSSVDHINHDGLDNRKSNLRRCSHRENMWASRRPKNNTSGIKNVFWRDNRWVASVTASGKTRTKWCLTKEEAAEWALLLRKQMHKEFAFHE